MKTKNIKRRKLLTRRAIKRNEADLIAEADLMAEDIRKTVHRFPNASCFLTMGALEVVKLEIFENLPTWAKSRKFIE
jgi:hypothetical protein